MHVQDDVDFFSSSLYSASLALSYSFQIFYSVSLRSLDLIHYFSVNSLPLAQASSLQTLSSTSGLLLQEERKALFLFHPLIFTYYFQPYLFYEQNFETVRQNLDQFAKFLTFLSSSKFNILYVKFSTYVKCDNI